MKIVLEVGFPSPITEAWFQEMFDKHGFVPRVGDELRVAQDDYNIWTKEQQLDYNENLDYVQDVYISLWHGIIRIGINQK